MKESFDDYVSAMLARCEILQDRSVTRVSIGISSADKKKNIRENARRDIKMSIKIFRASRRKKNDYSSSSTNFKFPCKVKGS